jgi:hypothetical protein
VLVHNVNRVIHIDMLGFIMELLGKLLEREQSISTHSIQPSTTLTLPFSPSISVDMLKVHTRSELFDILFHSIESTFALDYFFLVLYTNFIQVLPN